MSRLFDVKVNNYTCDIQRKSFKSILVYKFIANHKHMVFSFVIQYSQQIFLLIHVLYSIMIIHIKNLDNKYVSDRNFKNSAKRLAKDELAKKGHHSIEVWPWPWVTVVWSTLEIRQSSIWYAGSLGRSSHPPSIWWSKYYFDWLKIITLGCWLGLRALFIFIFVKL